MNKEITIVVATHKYSPMPTDRMYLPLQVGAAINKDNKGQLIDLGFAKDNTGDNISDKNPFFGTQTALYWAWKNLDCDYKGLVHYRRYFVGENRKKDDMLGSVITYDEIKPQLCKYKVFVPKKRWYVIETLQSHYNGPLADKNTTYSNKTIVIAGNLSRQKSAYIYQLNDITDHCHYNLYGIGYDGKDTENVSYKGAFSPDELISQLQGQYGLVWDGESCDTCSGAFGEYLKYNNPHKFSLYLAAGLPVIIWKSAALAVYVEKYGLGMCIDSLKELDSRLSAITSDDYLRMVENVAKYRKSLVNGCHLKEALD